MADPSGLNNYPLNDAARTQSPSASRPSDLSGYRLGEFYAHELTPDEIAAMEARGFTPSPEWTEAQIADSLMGPVQTGRWTIGELRHATDKSGGFLGDLGTLSSFAGMIPGPHQPFALGFNALNAADQGNWLGAGMSALGAAGINPIGTLGSDLGLPTWAANAAGSDGIGMLSGMDLEDAIRGAILSAGIGFAADTAAPAVNDAMNRGANVEAVGQPAYNVDELYSAPPADDSWKRRGIQVADASGDLSGLLMPPAIPEVDPTFGGTVTPTMLPLPPLMPPAVPELDPTFGGQVVPTLPPLMPAAKPEVDPTFGGELKQTAPGVFQQPGPQRVTSEDLQRYAKVAQKTYELLGGQEAATRGAPKRDAGEDGVMSPEEEQAYYDQVVSYLGLDAATMAQAGLVPGSPEYLDYILAQIDSIIGQVIGDANPDGEDFSALLRTKSAEELQSLNRAIYMRGQLGSLVGPGQYEDPFTGMLEDVAAPEGSGKFRPGVASWQRGLARSGDELAKMRGQEAKRFLGGMLDRDDSNIYGMQARRDAQAVREALESQGVDELKRRRRGMFGDEKFFQQELEGMPGVDIDRMLALIMGRDEGRQGAAVEELFGWQGV